MPRKERVAKERTHVTRVADPKAEPLQSNKQKKAKLKKELDEIVEEIDELLESNAEEFVSSYVQLGGE